MIDQALNHVARFLTHQLFDIHLAKESDFASRNYIIAPNHLSWIDPILIRLYWPQKTTMMFLGPRKVVTNTFWKGWFVNVYPEVILTDERTGWPGKTAVRAVLDGLVHGKSLVIFPEGDAFPEEGDVKPLYNGVAHFALKTGVPILPVGVCGTAELYYRKPLTIHIGSPIPVQPSTRQSKEQLNATLCQVSEGIRSLVGGYRDPVVAVKRMKWLTHLM